MMGKVRRRVRRVSMMDKAGRRKGAQGALFSRLLFFIRKNIFEIINLTELTSLHFFIYNLGFLYFFVN